MLPVKIPMTPEGVEHTTEKVLEITVPAVKIPMTPEGVEHVEGGEIAYGECVEDFYSTHCGEQGALLLWDNFTRALI